MVVVVQADLAVLFRQQADPSLEALSSYVEPMENMQAQRHTVQGACLTVLKSFDRL